MTTLVFDYDGTIQETLQIYEPAVLEVFSWLQSEGVYVEKPTTETISSWLGLRGETMWNLFAPNAPDNIKNEGSLRIGNAMRKAVINGIDPWFDGSREMLDTLKSRGYKMIVLSNCNLAYAQFNEMAFNMKSWFSEYIDCETHGGKSKATILSERIAKESVNEKVSGKYIVIGDRASDREAAQKNEIPFIACRYGYARKGELDGADAYADSVREIPDLVDKILKRSTK